MLTAVEQVMSGKHSETVKERVKSGGKDVVETAADFVTLGG